MRQADPDRPTYTPRHTVQVTHLYGRSVQPLLFVSAHLHAREQVTHGGQRHSEAFLKRKQEAVKEAGSEQQPNHVCVQLQLCSPELDSSSSAATCPLPPPPGAALRNRALGSSVEIATGPSPGGSGRETRRNRSPPGSPSPPQLPPSRRARR